MNFETQLPEWENEGTEPSDELKTNGFKEGYKPPAGIFNFWWSKVAKAIKEIQSGLSNVDNTKDSEKAVNYASEAGVGRKVANALTVRFVGGDTEGTDKWTFDGSTSRSINITPPAIGAAEAEALNYKVDKKEGLGLVGFGSTSNSEKNWQTIVMIDSYGATTVKKIPAYYSDLIDDIAKTVIATSTDGVTYTATVDNIAELYNGLELTVLFNMANTSTAPTLNVNGLGASRIRRPLSFNTLAMNAPEVGYIGVNRPIKLIYDTEYATGGVWKIADGQKVSAQDLYGDVPIESGGTGASTAAEALENLGITDYIIGTGTNGVWTYEKWNSGKAICRCRVTTSDTADPANVYSKELTLPFEFADTSYVVQCTAYKNSGVGANAFQYFRQETTAFWIGTNMASTEVNVEVVGKWK